MFRLLDWQLGWLGTIYDLVSENSGTRKIHFDIGSITQQCTGLRMRRVERNSWKLVAQRRISQAFCRQSKHRRPELHNSGCASKAPKCALVVFGRAYFEHQCIDPDTARR